MSAIGQIERATRNRFIALICNQLGYRSLSDRSGNRTIEPAFLGAIR
jgi:hypothetical protein